MSVHDAAHVSTTLLVLARVHIEIELAKKLVGLLVADPEACNVGDPRLALHLLELQTEQLLVDDERLVDDMLEREELSYLCLVEEVIGLLVEHGKIVAEVVCVELLSRVVSLLTLELSQFVDLDLGLRL